MKHSLIKYTLLAAILFSTTSTYFRSVKTNTKTISKQSLITDEQKNEESCLAIKSGITLEKTASAYTNSQNTVIWDNMDYWNDVAGIGRDDDCGLNQKQAISANDDAIITIGLEKIFPSDAENTNSFAGDNSFLIWGNNGESFNWKKVGKYNRAFMMERIWLVKETNEVGKVEVSVNIINLPDVTFNTELWRAEVYLINTAYNFRACPPYGHNAHKMTKNGNNYSIQYDFTDNESFTIGYVIRR